MTFPLSTTSATLLSCGFGAGYVAPLYLWRPAKVGPGKDRNHPDVIKSRLLAITFSSLIDCGIVYYIASRTIAGNISSTLSLLGFQWPTNSRSFLLTPVIYGGTLLSCALSRRFPQHESLRSWTGIRNYLVAPITEEIVFRSCCLAFAGLAGQSLGYQVWVTPLYFGIAHLHHGWETYKQGGKSRRALQRAITATLIQFTYTSLFGAFASFLTVRTQSILPALISHVFCNFMGLPSMFSEEENHPKSKYLLYTAHLAGIIGFSYLLFPWTM
ncbi:Abi-domain-containing protein [Dacryopinax primogenitus]|uniref:intramembrane prenyl-peptidase Rce1 n=1 Tax=Dacryopinax primogenitus (strain DJM 731) TaxID=1858805 RepID=M5G180_DACPD|nr:Abi-domain-containing protein [Dacryopinax primogenitus]EJU02489.1 Abi-domain-containing protein [Dacryopinax primogenitus]